MQDCLMYCSLGSIFKRNGTDSRRSNDFSFNRSWFYELKFLLVGTISKNAEYLALEVILLFVGVGSYYGILIDSFQPSKLILLKSKSKNRERKAYSRLNNIRGIKHPIPGKY